MSFKIISMFNHKGGVSKTTTTFNLAWMLASKGKRVLMVDADPQCNLTGVVLGLNPQWPDDEPEVDAPDDDVESAEFGDTQQAAEDFWTTNFERTLYGALKPAFDSEPRVLEAVDCIAVDGRAGLFLLPGHLRLGEYEVSLGIAQELAGSMSVLRNLPGAIHYLLKETAEALEADYVILDMSPALVLSIRIWSRSAIYSSCPPRPISSQSWLFNRSPAFCPAGRGGQRGQARM